MLRIATIIYYLCFGESIYYKMIACFDGKAKIEKKPRRIGANFESTNVGCRAFPVQTYRHYRPTSTKRISPNETSELSVGKVIYERSMPLFPLYHPQDISIRFITAGTFRLKKRNGFHLFARE